MLAGYRPPQPHYHYHRQRYIFPAPIWSAPAQVITPAPLFLQAPSFTLGLAPAPAPAPAPVFAGPGPVACFRVVSLGTPKPWKNPGVRFSGTPMEIPCSFTGQQLVQHLAGGQAGVAVTEFIELGGGKWSKGRTMKAGDAKFNEPIEGLGWSGKRGKENPIWLLVHW